jgi:hypothetical protein
MGFMRKALSIATFGLSGRVFKDNSKKQRTAKANAQRTRARKQTKVTRSKPQAARTSKPQAARRSKPQSARRSKPQSARTSTVAPIVEEAQGTTHELERLADLHVHRALTDEEFAAAKAKILGSSPTPPESDGDAAAFPSVEANVAAAHDDASVTTFGSD